MRTIAGIDINNTSNVINDQTRWCGLVYAPSGFGKTTFAATMDKMTKRWFGKPTIIIAVEAGEGGGTMSIKEAGVDYVVPGSFEEFERITAALSTDSYYGGVVLDSAGEYVDRFVQPYALEFPSREGVATRRAGVPERSDYQTMGVKARQHFNRLIKLTTEKTKEEFRKHLMVTALERIRTDPKGEILAIGPDLPGAMSGVATAMFQVVGCIRIASGVEQVEGKNVRVQKRTFLTSADGVRCAKDRTKLLPKECELDMDVIWEKYWPARKEDGM